MPAALVCHSCRKSTEVVDAVGRSALCAGCGSELRCCLNCRFYDASVYNECSETMAERVMEKDRANFCDYFSPGAAKALEPSTGGDRLSELEKLFRK